MSSPGPLCPQSSVPLTAAEELALMMREVTPELDSDFNDLASGGGQRPSSPSRDADFFTINNGRETEGISPSSGPMRSNEEHAARRLADRLGLFPYQKDALTGLARVDVATILI